MAFSVQPSDWASACFAPISFAPTIVAASRNESISRANSRSRRRPSTAPRPSLFLGRAMPSPPFPNFSSTKMLVLPPATQSWLTASILLSAASAGLVLESTPIGAALSAPLITMFSTLILSNLSLLPASSPIYTATTSYLVPLAVPLLLFSADIRRALFSTGTILRAFIVGTVGTLLGTLAAWRLVPLTASLGASDAWKIASALCARHIGGAVNYVATAEATGASPAAVAAGLAADNLIVALYFVLLFYLARNIVYRPTAAPAAESDDDTFALSEDADDAAPIRVVHMSVALALSATLCAAGTFLASAYVPQLGAIPVITALVVLLATLFPARLRPLCAAGSGLGIFFMQVFFAAIGASGSFVAVLRTAPALFAFSTVQLAVHLLFVLVVGRGLFRLKLEELLLASNANVGGPTTAAGMAAAKNWRELIVPCLLVGVFGYGVATFLSLALGHTFLKNSIVKALR